MGRNQAGRIEQESGPVAIKEKKLDELDLNVLRRTRKFILEGIAEKLQTLMEPMAALNTKQAPYKGRIFSIRGLQGGGTQLIFGFTCEETRSLHYS